MLVEILYPKLQKAISLVIALVICVGIIPISVFAEDAATYTITFDKNGGTGAIAPQTATAGVEFTLPASNGMYAPSGQRFKAWEIDGKEYIPGDKHIFTENTTAKAVWQETTGILKGNIANDRIGTIYPGTTVFTDRSTHLFSANPLPEWIIGQEYLMSRMGANDPKSNVSATVLSDGYVYIFARPDVTLNASICNQGFVRIATHKDKTLSTTFSPNAVYVKHVKAGETISFYWWGFMMTSKTPVDVPVTTMQTIASVAVGNSEEGGTTAKSGKIFADSDETFSTSLPAMLTGKDYIYKNNTQSNAGGKVTRASKIYISTPHTHTSSADSLLRELGFKYIKQLPESALGIGMVSSLYEKDFKAGDVLNCSKYIFIFAKSEEVEFLGAQKNEDSSCSAAFGIKAELLLSDASQITMVMGNKTYTTDLFGDASLIDWGEGYVYTQNEQGEDKLMFAIQIDNIGAEYMTEVDGKMVPNFKLYFK